MKGVPELDQHLGSRRFGHPSLAGGGLAGRPKFARSPIPVWYLLLLINNASVANRQHSPKDLQRRIA